MNIDITLPTPPQVRQGSPRAHNELRARLESTRQALTHGPDYVLHSIMDFIVDNYFPAVDELEERIDELEESLFSPIDGAAP